MAREWRLPGSNGPGARHSGRPRRARRPRLRVVAFGAGAVAVASLTACTPEDPAQRYVRTHVQNHLRTLITGYELDRTHCTGSPRPWFVEESTELYVCTARRPDGDCDWFAARLVGRDVTVKLDRLRGGCVLPS